MEVLITVPYSDDFIARLCAVDPGLIVRLAPSELRRWMRDPDRVDAETRAVAEAQAKDYLTNVTALIGPAAIAPEVRGLAPKLAWIQTTSAGVDRADPRVYADLTITNASGVAAVAIAEWVLGAVLVFAKQTLTYRRNQLARRWERRIQGIEVDGRTLGIVGMGAIGNAIAHRALGLGMRVLATRRSVTAPGPLVLDGDDPAALPARNGALLPSAALPDLLRESDFLVIAAPLTPETQGLIGADELALMKPSAVLINVGRGPIVHEAALLAALRNGALAGAALDVFDQEPLPADSPFWDMEMVYVSPHMSSGGDRYDERLATLISDNLRRFLDGRPLRNVVDLARGY